MAEERNLSLARATAEPADEDATKAELQRRMDEARESITHTVTEIKETVANQYQQVRETISDSLDWREQYRRRPLAFTIGAASVGLILGYSVAAAAPAYDAGPDSRPSYRSGYEAASTTAQSEPEQPSGPGLMERFKG